MNLGKQVNKWSIQIYVTHDKQLSKLLIDVSYNTRRMDMMNVCERVLRK